ncbi:organomercurial lyase [Streptomyces parvus]
MVTPDAPTSVRAAFCNQVHFFASADAAKDWLTEHPDAQVVPVADAFEAPSSSRSSPATPRAAVAEPASRGPGRPGPTGCRSSSRNGSAPGQAPAVATVYRIVAEAGAADHAE